MENGFYCEVFHSSLIAALVVANAVSLSFPM